MGKRSRERRKAKEQARQARSGTARAGGHTGGHARGHASWHADWPHAEERRGRQERRRSEWQPGAADHRLIAEQLVGAAVHGLHTGDDDVGAYTESLVAGLGVANGRRLVNLALLTWFDRIIESVWHHGWQPADVVRVVTRDGGARQARMAVDAIAAQMRRYAAPTVDETWEAQLSSLGATVWWERDDEWLDGWGEREGQDRAAVVGCALGVLHLLGILPPIPVLCPPPGAARRGSLRDTRRESKAADSRILDRVRALLAKAESTEFAEEAEALTAKAQQLIAQHSIDEAMLAAETGSRAEPGGRRIGIDNPYEQPKALLIDAVAEANRCRAVWMKEFGFATVIGFPSDVDAVELLYTSLLVQATTAMTREGSRQDRYGRSRTRSFRQSFLTAFAIRIRERLTAATDDASQKAAEETGRDRLLPVLAARTEAVNDATDALFPNLVARSVTANDAEGRAAGRAAADLASLRVREEVATAGRSAG